MSPYRASALPPDTGRGRWLARRSDMVWGEEVVTITSHRWYWTAWVRASLWLLSHEWGRVDFRYAPEEPS